MTRATASAILREDHPSDPVFDIAARLNIRTARIIAARIPARTAYRQRSGIVQTRALVCSFVSARRKKTRPTEIIPTCIPDTLRRCDIPERRTPSSTESGRVPLIPRNAEMTRPASASGRWLRTI